MGKREPGANEQVDISGENDEEPNQQLDMPTLSIRGTPLWKHNFETAPAKLFNPFTDPLALIIDCSASTALLQLPQPSMIAQFQIFDVLTDAIVFSQAYRFPLHDGPTFWVQLGNNWDPPHYQTAETMGLTNYPGEVFGFQGVIKAYSFQGAECQVTLDAFDVSSINWFRLMVVGKL